MKIQPAKKCSLSFTAIELLVVVSIILVLSTFSIISYTSWHRRAKIRSGARQTKAICSTARAMAIAQATNFQVAIDLDNRRVWVDGVDSFGNIVTPKVIHPEDLVKHILINEVKINDHSHTNGIARIQFRRNATADYARIYLIAEGAAEDNPENYYTVVIFPTTALAKVYDRKFNAGP